MKAIILARVSTKEQEDNNSIPAQTRRLIEYTDKRGLKLIETYQLVESSTKTNRKKFTELIKQIKQSKVPIALIVDTIDRLQRDFRESVLLDELRKQGKIELHFVRETLIITQTSNSADLMRWDMGVLFAKSYVTQLSDNVKRSFEQKWHDGEWSHRAPYGYRNVDKDNSKKWVAIDPITSIHVKDIFHWYTTETSSMLTVSKKLMEVHGVSKGVSSIEKILKNSFYCGIMNIKGVEYEHHYEKIIDAELFDLAQNIANRNNIAPRKYAGLPFPLRGMTTCGDCGCSITPERSKKYVYYHCTQFKGKHQAPYIREEELIKQLKEVFSSIKPTKEQYREVMDALKDSHQDKKHYRDAAKAHLRAELSKIENRITRLYDSYLDGDVTKDFYKKKNDELKKQRRHANTQLEAIDSADDNFYENGLNIMNLVRNAAELFESSEMEEKRRLLKLLLQNLVLENRELRWKYKKPFDLMASYTNNSSWLGIVDVFQEETRTASLNLLDHLMI